MAASKGSKEIEATKRLMGALVHMKPKPHAELKIGKVKAKKAKGPAKRSASSKPKTA
jgi:hypothetical protein